MNAISGNLVPKISDHLPTPFLPMVFKFGVSHTQPTYLFLLTLSDVFLGTVHIFDL